ncbi:uncharacterized protein LOC119037990 isoform X2 [Artibeus jamaicensis]|uniref:uncharacterized protein LOC119037990 isoform X2 n=1 Tax=Artibeus jamaicensis TaxID=9417 RepID=UPI00235A6F6D|nr:uncharacterized protein LOC119037990 isoform X2 [Artibeus jamaicensis]
MRVPGSHSLRSPSERRVHSAPLGSSRGQKRGLAGPACVTSQAFPRQRGSRRPPKTADPPAGPAVPRPPTDLNELSSPGCLGSAGTCNLDGKARTTGTDKRPHWALQQQQGKKSTGSCSSVD